MQLTSLLPRVRRIPAILQGLYLNRRDSVIAHSVGLRKPGIPSLIVPDLQPTDRDRLIAERLLGAYAKCRADEAARRSTPKPDVWSRIREQQSGFLQILDSNDPSTLAGYLCNMSRHAATTGTVQGDLEFKRIRKSSSYRRFITLQAKDKLVSLAEAVGAIPCENPEQGAWGKSLHVDIDLLVEKIEQVLGLDISPPPIDGGLLKIRSAKALFNERDLNALFAAWRLKQILARTEAASICEIGAGSGRVAYWSHRLGFSSYAILDLPHINVIQGYYLLKSLPDARMILYGESDRIQVTNRIAILPYFRIDAIEPDQFDLVLNQDSFPEINRDTVLEYLVWIKKASRQFFCSINHESRPRSAGGDLQISVPELVGEVGGYRRVSRVPYWLRRGYVEELYTITDR
jgi:hypothetical protein